MLDLLRLSSIIFWFLTLIPTNGLASKVSTKFNSSAPYLNINNAKIYGGLGSGFVDTEGRRSAQDTRGYNYGFNIGLNLQAQIVDHDLGLGLQTFNNSNGGEDFDTNAFFLEYSPNVSLNGWLRLGPSIHHFMGEDLGFNDRNSQRSATFWGVKAFKEFGIKGSDLDFRVSAKALRDFNVDFQRAYIGMLELQVSFPSKSKTLSKNQEVFNDQLFETNKVSINHEASTEISNLVKRLNNDNSWDLITIYGHADERGTEGLNKMLSLQRAKALRTELLKQGINPRKITIKALGSSEPLAIGQTDAEYSLNRRVSVEIN